MKAYSGLGKELKYIRKQQKLTQNELAKQLGIGQTAIANYETGKRFPDESMLIKLADILGVSIDRLLGRGTDSPIKMNASEGFNYKPSDLIERRDEYMDKALNSSRQASKMLLGLIDKGYTEEQILIDLLQVSLVEAGKRWAEGRYNEAMEHQLSMTVLQSMLLLQVGISTAKNHNGKAAFLTAAGENHNIGLKMLSRFLEMDGWECYYLGSSVPARTLQEYISAGSIDLICISATLNENVDSIASLTEAVKSMENPPFVMNGGSGARLNRKTLQRAGSDYVDSSISETINFTRRIKTLIQQK